MLNNVRTSIAALALLGTTTAAHASFLPPNNLHLQDNRRAATNVTEAQFNATIDEAIAYYGPFLKENFNANFKVNRLWTDSTVNASATQSGNTWTVNMYGGLARRPETTQDGFALVLCHEIGHHLGGYPFSSNWAADEGSADYFSTLSCARDLWKNQKAKNALSRELITAYPKSLCDAQYSNEDDQNLCYRTLLGGKSLGSLLAALGGTKAAYETPDKKVVSSTVHTHPAGQCRLDTYIAGALCTQDFDPSVIPGKDLGSKRNSKDAEAASGRFTCLRTEFKVGPRPLCWFKPLL
jgi:hypothetical protein